MDSSTFLRASSTLGLTSSIWLSGIYFSASQLTLPILYRLPSATSTDIFDELYHRGAATIGPLAMFATLSSGTAAYLDVNKRVTYLVAAGLAFAPLLFTMVFMKGTIDKLLEMSKDATVREKLGQGVAVSLLKKWTWMNLVRSGLALAGGISGLFALVGDL